MFHSVFYNALVLLGNSKNPWLGSLPILPCFTRGSAGLQNPEQPLFLFLRQHLGDDLIGVLGFLQNV